jgi:ElaB/YqjD/DUF883 family membrane-anchored ribosome-binding protein
MVGLPPNPIFGDTMTNKNLDAIKRDVEQLLTDAQVLFQEAKESNLEKADELRVAATTRIQQAIHALRDMEASAVLRSKQLARETNEYVHEKPWYAIGISAVVGLLLGVLISKR